LRLTYNEKSDILISMKVDIKEFPMYITELAVQKAKAVIDDDGSCLRIALQGGGCSGLQYKLVFDDQMSDEDYVTEIDGLVVAMDGHSANLLRGATLDYSSNLMASGFKFINPGAKRTCGCGSSFAS
jgi:iron-sulfur cluster assembly accessory protein